MARDRLPVLVDYDSIVDQALVPAPDHGGWIIARANPDARLRNGFSTQRFLLVDVQSPGFHGIPGALAQCRQRLIHPSGFEHEIGSEGLAKFKPGCGSFALGADRLRFELHSAALGVFARCFLGCRQGSQALRPFHHECRQVARHPHQPGNIRLGLVGPKTNGSSKRSCVAARPQGFTEEHYSEPLARSELIEE
jgi:hypothetical protein